MKTLNRSIQATILLAAIIMIVSACTKPENDTSGVDRYNHGVASLEAGDYENAIIDFEAALRADPSSFEAMKDLAGAYVLTGDFQEARDHFLLARDMRPTDASIYVNLAHVYQQLGETELAWENLGQARQHDPNYPLLHYRAGELFLEEGDDASAIAAFSDYIRLEPGSRLADDAEALVQQLSGTEELSEEDLEESEEEMTEEEELEEELTEEELDEEIEEEELVEEEEITEEEVLEEEEITEEEEIIEEEESEEEMTEEDETSEEEVTEEAAEEEETEEAAEEEEEATVEPELPDLEGDALYQDRLSRGRQMRAIGSSAAAIRLLTEAYEVHPDYAIVNYELALAYLLDGQTDQGKHYLQRYIGLETDPDLKARAQERLDALNGESASEDESGGTDDSGESSDESSDEGDNSEEEEDDSGDDDTPTFF